MKKQTFKTMGSFTITVGGPKPSEQTRMALARAEGLEQQAETEWAKASAKLRLAKQKTAYLAAQLAFELASEGS